MPVAIVLALALITLAVGVVLLLQRRELEHAAIAMGGGMVAIVLFATCAYIPHVRALTLAPRVAEELIQIGATLPGEEQMIGFKEPSLAFYQGGTIREQSNDTYLANTPSESWPRWTVIDDESLQKALSLNPAVENRFIRRARLVGSNIADGKRQAIVHVLEKKITPTTMP